MIYGCRRRKDVRGHNLSVKGMIEECIMAGRKQRKKRNQRRTKDDKDGSKGIVAVGVKKSLGEINEQRSKNGARRVLDD